MIKLVIFVCAIVAVNCEFQGTIINLQPELQAEVWKALRKCCANNEEIRDLISLIREGGVRHDDRFKTLVHCIWKETGFITDDGKLIVDKGAAAFPDKIAMKKILTECIKDMGSEPKENVYKTFKCFQEKSMYRVAIIE